MNQGLTMGFMIGYEDTGDEGEHKYYFYEIGEIPDTPETLTPIPPSLWSKVYLYAPPPHTWFDDPPTLTSVDMKSLEILTNPKVLQLYMYEEPAETAELLRESAAEYVFNMANYLAQSISWTDSLPLSEELQNEAEMRDVLDTMIVTEEQMQNMLFETITGHPLPNVLESAFKSTSDEVNNLLSTMFQRGTTNIEDLKQNAVDLSKAQYLFNPLLGTALGLGSGTLFDVDNVITLSSSNDPNDVFQFEQSITKFTTVFDLCSRLMEQIHEMNNAVIREIGR